MHSIMGFDWKKSKAHLLFLSKFIHAQQPDYFAKSDYWGKVLDEPPEQAIKRFVDEGILMNADLNELLSYKYKVNELKDMLKQRSLSVSGRKDEMIQRMMQIDPNGMKEAATGLTLLKCTQHGREIAEQYTASEKEKRIKVDQQVMEYIGKRMFREASMAVASYEAEQVFSRGIGIDWKNYDGKPQTNILNSIFNNDKPEILSKLDDSKLETLRIGAAMMELWGENTASKWLPPNFETGSSIDNDSAARMLLFNSQHKETLKGYAESGVQYVEILAANDSNSCESCKKLSGQRFKLGRVPELPNPNCTYKLGCRCVYLPCVD